LTVNGGTAQDIIKVATSLALNVKSGAGTDIITVAGTATGLSVDGGDGEDTIKFVNGSNVGEAATVIGGNGTDIIELTSATSSIGDASFAKVSGVETIKVSGTTSNAITLDGLASLTGVKNITLGAGTEAATVTVGSTYVALQGTNVLTIDAGGLAATKVLTLGNTTAGNIVVSNLVAGDLKFDTAATANVKVTSTNVGATGQIIATDAGADKITGGAAADKIIAGAAADIIRGGAGADSISAGAGNDKIVLNNAAAADVVLDTASGDVIVLDTGVFTSLAGVTLATTNVLVGAGKTAGESATQFLVYNTTTGDLYYDADGSGATAAVKIATLGTGGSIAQNGTVTDATGVFSVADAAALVGLVQLQTTAQIDALFA